MTRFPTIRTIDDVLPFVKHKPEFAVIERPDYMVIDYLFAAPDTFDSAQALECRGLKFFKDGKLMARPFHKFFNLNEKPQSSIDRLDWNAPGLRILEKLDGSMVHAGYAEGKIVLMTRKGYTDVAQKAMRECAEQLEDLRDVIEWSLLYEKTIIFEYTSPTNRIVLPYGKPLLRMIGHRDNFTGAYVDMPALDDITWKGAYHSSDNLVHQIKTLEGAEGVVIAWPDGHRVKIKADEYVLLHRNIDLMGAEKRVLEVVLEGKTDDLIPMLDEVRQKQLKDYNKGVNDAVAAITCKAYAEAEDAMSFDQKGYALWVQAHVDKRLQPIFFQYRKLENRGPFALDDLVREHMLKTLKTQSAIDSWRDLLGNIKYNETEICNEE